MKNLLKTAILAAIEAGQEILKIYQNPIDVEVKDDNSPLTLADKNANTVINKHLESLGIPIISEENKQLAYELRKDWTQCWIVDPLDGTKEFIKRNGEFTVNIALVENGTPVLGVIYVPVTGTLYFSSPQKQGAYKRTLKDTETIESIMENAQPIQPQTAEVVKIVGSKSHLNQDTSDFIKAVEETTPVEVVSKGSSLKFCLVAEGEAQIYPRFAPTMEWDTAAGDAICRAVGVSVIDQTTQQPMQYNKPNLLNNYFLVRYA